MPSDVRHSRANLRSTLEVDRLTAIRAPLNLTPTKPRAAELCLKLPMYRIYGPVIQCRRAKYSTRYHCESRTAAIPIVTGEFCNWLSGESSCAPHLHSWTAADAQKHLRRERGSRRNCLAR